jgi:hypothetical protein
MAIDATCRVQPVYVPVSGVRLAVDVWLPVEQIAAGSMVAAISGDITGPPGH